MKAYMARCWICDQRQFPKLGTTERRTLLPSDCLIRTNVYIPVVERIISELKRRFSNENCSFMRSMAHLNPQHQHFLDADQLTFMTKSYKRLVFVTFSFYLHTVLMTFIVYSNWIFLLTVSGCWRDANILVLPRHQRLSIEFICICICICICTCICICMCVCMYIYIYIYIYACVRIYTFI